MKCPKCGNSKIVDSANGKKCVNCNFEWKPKKTGCFTWFVAIFVAVFIFPIYLGGLWHNEEVIQKNISSRTSSATSNAQTTSAPKS